MSRKVLLMFLLVSGGNSKRIGSLSSAFEIATINHPPLMKSNTVTRFKIISGLRNSVQNHKRVPVYRNKQCEEGYWKDFYN